LIERKEEADRQAEIERLEQLAEHERWRKQDDQQRTEQSIEESKEHLAQIIQQWANTRSISQFLDGVEQSTDNLPETEKNQINERLKLAREFLGTVDPLDFFLSWKTPIERYRPIYPAPDKK